MSEDFKSLDDLLSYGYITPSDYQSRFEEILTRKNLDLAYKSFQQFSQDGKNLEAQSFSHFVTFLGESYSAVDLENLFYLVDQDHNGLVSFSDLLFEYSSYDSYELELFRFVQNKLKSRSFLSKKLSPSSGASAPNSEFVHLDIGLQFGQINQSTRSFTLRRTVSDQLASEIRTRAQSDETSCLLSLTFLLSQESPSAETQEAFLNLLKEYYEPFGLYFQNPIIKTDKGKHYLVFDGLIKPVDYAIDFLELWNPQLVDGRIDLDTSSVKLGAAFNLKTSFARKVLDLPIFRTEEQVKQLFTIPKDLVFKLNLNSFADILSLEVIEKEFLRESSKEFKEFIQQISDNNLTLQDTILKLFYDHLKKNSEPEIYAFFKVYPKMIENLDSLQSITLLIKNQIFSLDVNFEGFFKILPKPTQESLQDFAEIKVPGNPKTVQHLETRPLVDDHEQMVDDLVGEID